MSDADDVTGGSGARLRARKRSGSALLVLATVLLLVAAAVGVAYILLRPTTLRIAVGPSGSSDQAVIQGLAQHFAQDKASVRLSVVTTPGPVDSIAELSAGNADLAVARA